MAPGTSEIKPYYTRHLPHWQPEGRPVFITWRLNGSLPVSVLLLKKDKQLSAGKAFLRADQLLDKASTGPVWLKDPRIASSVVDTLLFGANELKLYELFAYVVMSNHVHILVHPHVPLARVTHSIKGFTARSANRILGRKCRAFWQDESFDHWVRNAREFNRIAAYIEGNPVKAGLVEHPEDWPWSSRAGLPACPL